MSDNTLSAFQSVRVIARMYRCARKLGGSVSEAIEMSALGYLAKRHEGTTTSRLFAGQAKSLGRRIAARENRVPVDCVAGA